MRWFGKKKQRVTTQEFATRWVMAAVKSASDFAEGAFGDSCHPKTAFEAAIFHLAAFDYVLRRGLVPPVYERVHQALVESASSVFNEGWRVSDPLAYIDSRIAQYQELALDVKEEIDLLKLGNAASLYMIDSKDLTIAMRCSVDFMFILKHFTPVLQAYEIVR
jgi:hypothetical protein